MDLKRSLSLCVILLSLSVVDGAMAKGCPQMKGKTCKKGTSVSVKLTKEMDFDKLNDVCLFSDISCKPEDCHDHDDCSGVVTPEMRDKLLGLEKDFNRAITESKTLGKKVEAPAGGSPKEKDKIELDYHLAKKRALDAITDVTAALNQDTDKVDDAWQTQQDQVNGKVKAYSILLNTHGIPAPDEYVQKTLGKYRACMSQYDWTLKIASSWEHEAFDLNETQQKPDIYAKIKAIELQCGYPENLNKAIAILEEREALGATDVAANLAKLKKSRQAMEQLYTRSKKTVDQLKVACTSTCPQTKVNEASSHMLTWLDGSEKDSLVEFKAKLENNCVGVMNLRMSSLESFEESIDATESSVSKYLFKYAYCFGPQLDKAYAAKMTELKVVLTDAQSVATRLRMCPDNVKVVMAINHKRILPAEQKTFGDKFYNRVTSIIQNAKYAQDSVEKLEAKRKKMARLCKVANDPTRVFGPPAASPTSPGGTVTH